jgi:hypothetical protein
VQGDYRTKFSAGTGEIHSGDRSPALRKPDLEDERPDVLYVMVEHIECRKDQGGTKRYDKIQENDYRQIENIQGQQNHEEQ